jgi:hypothetical protein
VNSSALKSWIFSVILGVTLSGPAVSGESSKPLSKAEAAVVDADSARFRAMIERDLPTLRLVLADELVYIHSSSTRQTKSEHLADLERGAANYSRIDVKEQVPYVYGGTGLIQGVATFTTGTAGRESAPFTLRYTSVYVKRQGRWQMVAFSCSRITDGGAAPRGGGPPSP